MDSSRQSSSADTAAKTATPEDGVNTPSSIMDQTTDRLTVGSQSPTSPTSELVPIRTKVPTSDATASTNSGNVLFARQGPLLSVETVGPKRISVGKPSTYDLSIRNAGEVAADQTVVTVDLPDWADVLGTEPSAGSIDSIPASAEAPHQLRWQVGRLEAKGRERLALKIVPRESRPLDLSVKWDYTPTRSQTVIEVQEARLAMQLDGPREVLYGKAEAFRLEITNTGNGGAENVVLSLFPMGPTQGPPATHQFGDLAAGEKKVVEVELTARHSGALTIKVDAQAEGGVEAHLAEKILVRRAELAVAVEAPAIQYVGANVTYRICVKNPGNAAAKNLEVTASLPPEIQYVSSLQDGRPNAGGKKVTWTAESLSPGGEVVLLLTCNLQTAGVGRIDVSAKANDDLAASGDAATQIESMADLALTVSDPPGPIPVGQETVYELEIHNRGTKAAENVDVVVYFSYGVEPVAAEGSRNRIGAGQVVFDPIAAVAAGENLVLKVRARADAPGNHVCRAEVSCKPLGTRLVSEETTHYYSIANASSATSSPVSQPEQAPAASATEEPANSSESESVVMASKGDRPTLAPVKK